VRYPRALRWRTVAVFDLRPPASDAAAHAYRNLANASGETPHQVRVLSGTQLIREGGQRGLKIARADIAAGAPP
jgi:hypothetical protein